MQLQQLRYAVAVAEELHFTRAAEKLGVAQPSVSSAVRELERELGSALFHREHGTVELTAAGEVFLPWARRALADVDRSKAEVQELQGLRRGRLTLGATPSLTTGLLPPVLAEFHRQFPDIELALRQAGSRVLVEAVEQGDLDLALVILPVASAGLTTIELAREDLVLAVAPDHALAKRKQVTVADLKELPLVLPRDGYDVRVATIALCRAEGFEPLIAVEAGEMDGVLAMVGAGLGAAVVPRTVVDSPLRALTFRAAAPTRTIGIAARADRPPSRAAEEFVTAIRRALDDSD